MRQFVSGNLNYSSWSIRPLLVARKVGLPVEEIIVPLDFPETSAKLKSISPTAKVPLLIWDGLEIWESLAIAEFIAEWAPPGEVWPEALEARAIARAVSSEMHAGFAAIRNACSMDIRARHPAPDMTPALRRRLYACRRCGAACARNTARAELSCSANGRRRMRSSRRSSRVSALMACR